MKNIEIDFQNRDNEKPVYQSKPTLKRVIQPIDISGQIFEP